MLLVFAILFPYILFLRGRSHQLSFVIVATTTDAQGR